MNYLGLSIENEKIIFFIWLNITTLICKIWIPIIKGRRKTMRPDCHLKMAKGGGMGTMPREAMPSLLPSCGSVTQVFDGHNDP